VQVGVETVPLCRNRTGGIQAGADQHMSICVLLTPTLPSTTTACSWRILGVLAWRYC
jgi:hypothetical protein